MTNNNLTIKAIKMLAMDEIREAKADIQELYWVQLLLFTHFIMM